MRSLIRIAVLSSLVVAGCGGDTAPATTVPPPVTTAGTTAPATTTPAVATTTSAPGTTVSSIPAGLAWHRVAEDWEVFGGFGRITMQSVTEGGPGLVAVGWDESPGFSVAAVWTSVDGVIWSRVPHDDDVFGTGEPGGWEMRSVAVAGPGLVAVGYDGSAGQLGAAAVWTSSDGLMWSRVAHDEAVFGGPWVQEMNSVVAGGPGLVAVGRAEDASGVGRAAVWTSADGRMWSRVSGDQNAFNGSGAEAMHSVTAWASGLVAVGRSFTGDEWDAAVWTSVDGMSWSRVPHDGAVFGGPDYQWMSTVIAGGPGLVVVGWDGTADESVAAVWTSPDGLVWSRVPHDEAVFGGPGRQWMTSVVTGGPGLVAVGFSDDAPGLRRARAAVWTSPDGLVWSRVPHDEVAFEDSGGQAMNSVIKGGPGLVVVGSADGMSQAAVWLSPPPG